MPKRQQEGGYDEVLMKGGAYKRRRIGAKGWQYMCKHAKFKNLCKVCGGASICEHGSVPTPPVQGVRSQYTGSHELTS